MRSDRLEASVTFDPARGYIGTVTGTRTISTLSLGGLREAQPLRLKGVEVMNFPRVLAAVRAADFAQWDIGDALVRHVDSENFAVVLAAVEQADAKQWGIGDALIAETGTRENPKCYGELPGYLTFEQWLEMAERTAFP
jgi:hypothetical protein